MPEQPRKKARAGWYPHPKMADTVRYWDGEAWTDHIAPANQSPEPTPKRSKRVACAYCKEPIAPDASRCPHCSGLFFYCKHDKKLMPVTTKSKWVGVARGGRQDSHRCQGCGRIISGAKW